MPTFTVPKLHTWDTSLEDAEGNVVYTTTPSNKTASTVTTTLTRANGTEVATMEFKTFKASTITFPGKETVEKEEYIKESHVGNRYVMIA